MVTIEVIKDNIRGYGYNLKHNQPNGFKGIITDTWAWYRYKKNAIESKKELEKCWN